MLKKIVSVGAVLAGCILAQAGELAVSTVKPPIVVTSPDDWIAVPDGAPSVIFPFETYRVAPPASHNTVLLISILANNKPELSTPAYLKGLLRRDSRPYVKSPAELASINIKEIKLADGFGYYANFVDPELASQPVKLGTYKTATPCTLALAGKYLLKVTIYCDEIGGADYKAAMKIAESLRIKKAE